MSEQTAQRHRYTVSADESNKSGDALIFTLVPEPKNGRANGRAPNREPEFVVTVRPAADGLAFDWSASDDPGTAREEMEAEITTRMNDREAWINRVTGLVDQVEQWAKEMGWSTRRVDKRVEDNYIGKHRVPALLMQQDTFRALLEPIGRSAPGADGGVVDLYLMPAYDDIASLYYYDDRWNIHYNTFRGTNAVVPESKENAKPLTKKRLEKVLAEMRQHAA